MAPIPELTASAGEHSLDVAADPDTQVDDLEGLAELAKHASSKKRCCMGLISQSRRIKSVTIKTVQQAREKLTLPKQGTLMTEAHSMDEERRSLAELHILKGRARK
jgi:hypothetical protein